MVRQSSDNHFSQGSQRDSFDTASTSSPPPLSTALGFNEPASPYLPSQSLDPAEHSPSSPADTFASFLPSGLRLRRALADDDNHDSPSTVNPYTASRLQDTSSSNLASSSNMLGSSSSRGSYLPLGGQSNRTRGVSSSLVSWAAKHKAFVAFVFVSLQVYFVGPSIMDSETVKKLKADGWQWPGLSSGVTQDAAEAPAEVSFEHPTGVGPHSFPALIDQDSWGNSPETLDRIYPDADPHRGELPTYLKSVLEKEPQLATPPWPSKAPNVTEGMWPRSKWHGQSRTTFIDAYEAEKQPLEEDWRQPPWTGWKPPLEELAASKSSKPLPKVQHSFQDPARHSGRQNDPARDELIQYRQKMVRNAFLHAWEGYKKFAWGHDELRPVSKKPQDNFNGWGATIVDALDTLLIMELPDQYDLARQHVRDIDFRAVGGDRSVYGAADGKIPVFETAIRYLGGFISAYDLSGDTLMRDRAEELAQLILPAFETTTGVPLGRIRLAEEHAEKPSPKSHSSNSVVLAEAGSLLLEFTRLWQVTGNRTYFDRVQRTTDWLDRNMTSAPNRLGSLFPTTLYPDRNQISGAYSFGGMADSYYEYLIKEHQLLAGKLSQYGRMYSDSIKSAKAYLIQKVSTVPGVNLMTIGELNGQRYTPKLEHLTCFSGGMLGLGSRLLQDRATDLDYGKSFTETCWWAYNSTVTGIGPENLIFYGTEDSDRFSMVSLQDGTQRRGKPRGYPIVGVRSSVAQYLNRPETIESVFYMWRITGDEQWQERGWQMFSSWVTHCMTDAGFTAIHNVHDVPASWSDSMESFTFAETFKYYYLLFSPPELISLDEFTFTTEAHPLLAPKNGKWAVPGQGSKKFWTLEAGEESHLPSRTSGSYSGGERQQVGGLTNNQKHIIYKQLTKKQARIVAKSLIGGFDTKGLKSKFKGLLNGLEWDSIVKNRFQTEEEGDEEVCFGSDCEEESQDLAASLTSGFPSPEEVMAGTKMYELEDGTLTVELNQEGDLTLQTVLLEKLGFHEPPSEELDLGGLPESSRISQMHLEVNDEAKEQRRIAQAQRARLRSKGVV